ncbi:hypothetical protein [Garicola koreensis]|uniref:Uncharacterized protein n=1 Tax=Garicola koreensis TaxID=1262554 RepID=A0A7W5TSR1_9MICC|nr:hypothetical protein [Garicola koreensis]MBB3666733.1 hypothetical protein [Garicola koreensis]
MSTPKKNDAGTAVWYFVAATFAATLGPTVLSPGAGHWTTFIWIGLALILLVLGGIVLGREMSSRGASAD